MMADLVTAADDAQLGHPGLPAWYQPHRRHLALVMGMRKGRSCTTRRQRERCGSERIGMINHAFPKDELEERTTALADRTATLSADHLAILKLNMNRFYETWASTRRCGHRRPGCAGQFTATATPGRKGARIERSGTGLKGALDGATGRTGSSRKGANGSGEDAAAGGLRRTPDPERRHAVSG